MKTITPFELQMLIDQRYVEVIDVRTKDDFKKAHVFVARSIPLKNFEPHSVLAHRRGEKNAPIYIVADRKAQASLVACGLASAGLPEPMVVDGGVGGWEAGRFPVTRERSWQNLGFAIVSALSAWSRRVREWLHLRESDFRAASGASHAARWSFALRRRGLLAITERIIARLRPIARSIRSRSRRIEEGELLVVLRRLFFQRLM